MKPDYAIYVLESQWIWDHTNTEIATTTIESKDGYRYETEYEKIIDPLLPKEKKAYMIADLKRIARAQNKCVMDETPRLKCLYRVVDADGIIIQPLQKGETPRVNLILKLICEFDNEDNPVIPTD